MTAAKRLVTTTDVAEGIERLNLQGNVIKLHVSLRSFPRLDGGPQTLIDSFLEAGCTLLIPTMANEASTAKTSPRLDCRRSTQGPTPRGFST